MRSVVRTGVLVVAVTGAVSLLPVASASAATTSTACTKTTLLLPGATVSCTTPAAVCPSSASTVYQCKPWATAAATAAVGIGVAATVESTSTLTLTPPTGAPTTDSAAKDGACTAQPLVLVGGCTASTDRTTLTGVSGDLTPFGYGGVAAFSSVGRCQWTGGPIAVQVTLTCTQLIDSVPLT